MTTAAAPVTTTDDRAVPLFAAPLRRIYMLAGLIAVGGLVLGGMLIAIAMKQNIGLWSLTFNVGLLLVLFGLAGLRVVSLVRQVVREMKAPATNS